MTDYSCQEEYEADIQAEAQEASQAEAEAQEAECLAEQQSTIRDCPDHSPGKDCYGEFKCRCGKKACQIILDNADNE
jgi:hypothetical protein